MNRLRDLFEASRPRQWVKNVLVFAAPGAAGVLAEPAIVVDTVAAASAFVLVSSALYLVNDVLDRTSDLAHPAKRHRPIAAGRLSVGTAVTAAGVLTVAGAAVGATTGELAFLGILALYGAITLAYSAWLKHVAVIDLAAVASGYVLRAMGGAAAVDIPVSDWFLIVAMFGSLMMVTGKRRAELAELDEAIAHRAVLDAYTIRFLDHVLTVATGVVLLAYCLWAFETAAVAETGVYHRASVVPFTLAVLRYVFRIETGGGGAPEEVVLRDPGILALGLVWLAIFGLGVLVS